MAAAQTIARIESADSSPFFQNAPPSFPFNGTAHKFARITGIKGVFRGHELTPKAHRVPCGLKPIDNLIGGGIVRGRISEIIAEPGAGKTSLTAAFAASITAHEAAAWISASDNFDPASISQAGIDLTRLLWVSCCRPLSSRGRGRSEPFDDNRDRRLAVSSAMLKSAEWILAVGGFGLVILDFNSACHLRQSAALRLARIAEQSGAAILVLTPRRVCGTFAVMSLVLRRQHSCFSRIRPDAPALFDGLIVEARVERNKLGGSGQAANWKAVADLSATFTLPGRLLLPSVNRSPRIAVGQN